MVKITCQHSGIEFEASSARTKQHPQIAEMKVRANRNGNYREVLTALDTVKDAGGYTTIDEYVKLAKDHIAGKKQAAQNLAVKLAEGQKREAERKAAFEKWLSENNYTSRIETYTETYDNPNPRDAMDEILHRTRTRTIWTAPDGQEVGLAIANQIFDGKTTLTEYRAKVVAEAEAKAAKEAEDAAKDKARDDSRERFRQKRDEIRRSSVEVERFEVPTTAEIVVKVVLGARGYPEGDEVRKVIINDVTCYRIVSGAGYDDDGFHNYYSDDPAKAGLTPIKTEPRKPG